MSDAKKPPAFFCPACGQKHRTNLDSLTEKPGSVMHLACVGCKEPLALSVDLEGAPVCVRDERPVPAPEETSPAEAPGARAAAPARSRKGGSAGKGGKGGKKKDAPVPRSKRKGAAAAAATTPTASKAPSTEPTTAPEAGEDGADAEVPDPAAGVIEAEFSEGDRIGRYTVEKAIGQGGCSTVYRAFDATTNRAVALKVLANDAAEVIQSRFLREIEVQANIRHQNIMPVFDRGTLEDGRPFFTMELLYRPWTLAQIIAFRDEGKLNRYATLKGLVDLETLVREVVLPVADGIYVANVENGVIHRDLKPDNVLVDSRTMRPYVIDFGICHVLERKAGFASKTVIPPTTEDEGIVGTPRFLAPEQVKGSAHARTDVWGLGAILFHAVTGEPPIASAQNISKAELKRRVAALEETKKAAVERNDDRKIEMCEEMLVRLTDPNLRTVDELFKDARDGNYSPLPASTPAGLKAVITKALSKSPTDRYVNARQLGTELQAWVEGHRVRALTEVGGKAAAVESARRAVRTHTVTTVWLLVGAVVGFGLAWLFARPGAAPPSSRVDDAKEDIRLLDGNLEGMARLAGELSAVERDRLWAALDRRANQIGTRLAGEPDVAEVHARQERLDFVRRRFQPPRYRFDVPADLPIQARSLVTGATRTLAPGESSDLTPGAYSITVGDVLRFPVDVPLVIRSSDKTEKAAVEPPLAVYQLPIESADIPSGMRLVLGDRVLARDRPFNPPSAAPTNVPDFLMDETEVTNSAYARFLATLSKEERAARTPQVGFVPDESGAAVIIKGREDVPVVAIRAEDASAYAAWRAKLTGKAVRLPTEAEWVLAAGATLGRPITNGARGDHTEAEFTSPLRNAGQHAQDVSPYAVKGMLGNAREMVTPYIDDLAKGAVLVKGAGVGDDPDQGAIYIHRVLPAGERHPTTGFRCVQELPGAKGPGG
jgi:serine/threonine protein kinase